MRKELQLYTTTTRHVVARFMRPDDQQFFKPSKLPIHRLKHIGIHRRVPMITANMCMTDQHEGALLESLVELRTKLTPNTRQALHANCLVTREKRLLMRGSNPWKATISTSLDNSVAKIRTNAKHTTNPQHTEPPPTYTIHGP